MSLQLMLGGSGSGKSHELYTKVIQEAIAHPEKNYIVIVPEQFTMRTQQELVKLHPAHGILNIDILSFQRLAYRVFAETGSGRSAVLTETGKNLLLRKVASDKREELQLLGSKLEKPGYISEMKSILSELAQYEISEEQLEEMVELTQKRPLLQYKLKDIQILYEGFREYRREKFITAEEVLDVFCQAAEQSQMLRRSVLAFDGFTGFTPVQQKALAVLFGLVPEVWITVTLDERETFTGKLQEHELFCLSKKTIQTLLKLAEKTGTEVEEPIWLSGENGRFGKDSALNFLEQHLFRYEKRTSYFWKDRKEEILLREASTPQAEVRAAAAAISRMVKKEGYRYREIGVIAGDLSVYGNYVKKLFEEYEIPCFVDQTVQILLNPCLEFIRGTFELVEQNFSYESVFRFLRTGFAGMAPSEIDRMENYVLALGIRGKYGWQQEWMRETLRMAEGEAEFCEGLRKAFMEKMEAFLQVFAKREAVLEEYADALYELLVTFQIQKQLKEMEQSFADEGSLDKVNEYRQIYGILMGLLDEAVELLGKETVSRKEFKDILEAGFSEAKVGIIPPGIDQVQVGDIERTRLDHIRVLFFLGVNDGWIPAKEGSGGIVSDLDREFLQERGMELAPTARENSYIQRFYLYLGLTKPSERLYLSYCHSSNDGAAMHPSYLIGTIRKLFPQLSVKAWEEEGAAQITSYQTGLPYLSEQLRKLSEQIQSGSLSEEQSGLEAQVKELLEQYRNSSVYKEQAEELLEAAFLVLGQEQLERRTASELYGEVLENSVTRLEQYASCAFAHFAAYGLQLQEREEYQVRSADIGNIFHRALEVFARKLERSEYNWFTVPEEVRETLMEESVEETVERYGSGVFFSSERNRYVIQRMKRILKRSVWALHEQIRAGQFVPSSFEVSFTAAQDLDAVNIALSETEKMRLKGRIDRIDVCETQDKVYVKVVDYKSGNTSFDLVALYYGLQLQLVVYLNAALELERRMYPEKEVIPAGIFYYRLKDPILDGSREQTPEEIQQELLKKLRPEGLVNESPEVIERMDAGMVKNSNVIPVGKKADGSLTALSSVADTGQLETLSQFVQEKLETLGREILDGTIKVNPYKRKDRTACAYCVYQDLCGFDRKIPGHQFRQLRELPKAEVWKKVSEEETEKRRSAPDGKCMDKGTAAGN